VVSVVPDAFFLEATRSASRFLRADRLIVAGEPHYGCPHSAGSGPIDMAFYLDDVEEPSYQRRESASGFEGNSLPVSVWQYCDLPVSGPCPEVGAMFPLVATGVNTLLLPPSGCAAATDFTTLPSGALQNNLRAAAFNIASGRGIFAPYRQVQDWYFAFAKAMYCSGSTVSSDQDLALSLLHNINSATDLDRY